MEKLETLTDPDSLTAANHIINAVLAEKLITVHVRCSIEYEGRAASTIEEGDRIVIAKPDGTLLVHGEENYQPINWQPSGADITADVTEDDQLLIIGETDEYLEIECSEVYQLSLFNHRDTASLQLRGTEEEMHNRIMKNPELVEDGLHNVVNEKKFSFGRVDIFGKDTDKNTVIVEVKRRAATRDHVYQLYTYMMEYEEKEASDEEIVRGILVAPSCTEYIKEVIHSYGLEFVQLDPI
jgi:RecB family endonuclease NucS